MVEFQQDFQEAPSPGGRWGPTRIRTCRKVGQMTVYRGDRGKGCLPSLEGREPKREQQEEIRKPFLEVLGGIRSTWKLA